MKVVDPHGTIYRLRKAMLDTTGRARARGRARGLFLNVGRDAVTRNQLKEAWPFCRHTGGVYLWAKGESA